MIDPQGGSSLPTHHQQPQLSKTKNRYAIVPLVFPHLSSHALFLIACVVTALTLFVMGAVKVRAPRATPRRQTNNPKACIPLLVTTTTTTNQPYQHTYTHFHSPSSPPGHGGSPAWRCSSSGASAPASPTRSAGSCRRWWAWRRTGHDKASLGIWMGGWPAAGRGAGRLFFRLGCFFGLVKGNKGGKQGAETAGLDWRARAGRAARTTGWYRGMTTPRQFFSFPLRFDICSNNNTF